MTIQGSAQITALAFRLLYRLDGVTPSLDIINLSSGPGLAQCKFWFECYTPDGTIFHTGTLATPDKVGVWASLTIAEAIPQILGHLPWGDGFQVRGYVNDGTNTYGPEVVAVGLCRPVGNTLDQKNNFGAVALLTEAQCAEKKLYCEDRTDYTYQSVAGVLVSKKWKFVTPPADADAVPQVTENTSGTATVLFATPHDSAHYQVLVDTVMDHAVSSAVTVRLKYKANKTVEVYCDTSLCALVCGIEKLEAKIQSGGCSAAERDLLFLTLSKFSRLMAGMRQPDCGVNIAALKAEIEKLLGIHCGCK